MTQGLASKRRIGPILWRVKSTSKYIYLIHFCAMAMIGTQADPLTFGPLPPPHIMTRENDYIWSMRNEMRWCRFGPTSKSRAGRNRQASDQHVGSPSSDSQDLSSQTHHWGVVLSHVGIMHHCRSNNYTSSRALVNTGWEYGFESWYFPTSSLSNDSVTNLQTNEWTNKQTNIHTYIGTNQLTN